MLRRFVSSILLLLTITSCRGCEIKKESAKPWADVLDFAEKNLPREGTLVQQADGYAYVKVDDRYINDLFPMLKTAGFEKPPYFRREDSPGAHISVFYEDEHVRASEIGEKFTFTLNEIALVGNPKKISYIVLLVKAPELEELRKKYGLSPLLKNNDFHITLARKIEKRHR